MASSWRELLFGKDDKGLKAIKQVLAGAAEGTIANASERGGYRPAVVDAIPAVAGVVQELTGTQFKSKAANQFVENSLRRARLASERTNRTLGITNPQDTDELGLRVAGGMILATPKAAQVEKVVRAIPRGAQAVEATKKVVQAVPKPARTGTRIVGEVVTPFRTTKPETAAKVGVGVTAVLDTLLDQTIDPSTGEKYEGNGLKAVVLGDEVDTATPDEDELDQFMLDTALDTGDVSEDDLDLLMASPVTEEEQLSSAHEDKLNGYEKAAIGIGAVLAGGMLAARGRQFMQSRWGAATNSDNIGRFERFTGKKYTRSQVGRKDKLVTELFEQDRPIRNMAEEYLGRDYAKNWGYRADAMTNASIQSRVRHFFETGKAPGSALRSEKLAPLAEAYAKELMPNEQILVSDALNAASALDDYNRTGVLAAMTKDRQGNIVTPRQLQQLVTTVQSNPKYNKYFNAIQKSYDDLLRYRVLRGMDTIDTYRQMRRDRPNYVPHNRNLEPDVSPSLMSKRYSANEDFGMDSARSTEQGGGVSGATGVGNPFVSVFDEWAQEIRRSELNNLRGEFLVRMEATGARNARGNKLVEKVNPNDKGDEIHQVRVNGKTAAYRVRDPEVARALHFAPRRSIHLLDGIRMFQQNLTTGPVASLFNFFATSAAPVFDSMAANLLRGKGVKLGASNRVFIGGHLGAMRYLWDDIRGNVGRTLRDNLIRENSWLKNTIGERNLDNLATYFENAYENSIKAEMDELGITSHTMYGSPDPSELLTGVEQLAPTFSNATQRALRSDINDAVLAGDMSKLRGALATSKSAYISAKSNAFVRAYSNVVEAMHNGARYTAYAANRGRSNDMAKLASDMRRLSADASKHGASDAANAIIGANMYAPIAMQTMFEVGRRFRENPGNVLFNAMTTAGTVAAMHYLSLANDEEALDRHLKKSPQQKAVSVSLAGGIEMKLDPMMRLVMAPLLPLYDHMSGLTSGKFDPNFMHVMDQWLDGETPDWDENVEKDLEIRIKKGIDDNLPINVSSFPPANIIVAALGVDPGMSRITGETTLEREQQLTGMDEGVDRPGSLVSSHMENMITATLSTTGRSMLGIADDAYRALSKDASGKEALNIAAESWTNQGARSAGVLKPLFGDYETVNSASDLNFALLKDREPGIERAIKVYNKDYRGAGITSVTNKKAAPLPTEPGVAPPEIEGTELAYIAEMANQLENMWLKKNRDVLARLGKQVEAHGAQFKTSIEQRNININDLQEERKYQRMLMVTQVREYEELISQKLGRKFTFDEFNPDDFLNPLVPSN